jgi:hypothetical protein
MGFWAFLPISPSFSPKYHPEVKDPLHPPPLHLFKYIIKNNNNDNINTIRVINKVK